MSQYKHVKLYIYEDAGDKTYIDTIEATSFDEFVLIKVKDEFDSFDLDHIKENFAQLFQGKRVVVVPAHLDISFYGIEKIEDDDSRLIDRELQHEGSSQETS